METYTKDPQSVLDYNVDWSQWLGSDTISISSFSVLPAGLTLGASSKTPTVTTIWVSDGVVNNTYTITNTIITANGRTVDRSFNIVIIDR